MTEKVRLWLFTVTEQMRLYILEVGNMKKNSQLIASGICQSCSYMYNENSFNSKMDSEMGKSRCRFDHKVDW